MASWQRAGAAPCGAVGGIVPGRHRVFFLLLASCLAAAARQHLDWTPGLPRQPWPTAKFHSLLQLPATPPSLTLRPVSQPSPFGSLGSAGADCCSSLYIADFRWPQVSDYLLMHNSQLLAGVCSPPPPLSSPPPLPHVHKHTRCTSALAFWGQHILMDALTISRVGSVYVVSWWKQCGALG